LLPKILPLFDSAVSGKAAFPGFASGVAARKSQARTWPSARYAIGNREGFVNLFEGLYSYEIVLLLLGVVLFLTLLVALLRNVFKDKPYVALIPAFFIPIVMIGYPSIESFKYQDGLFEIQKATNAVQNEPSNPQAQAQLRELQAKVNKIAPRAMADPRAKEILTSAHLVLARGAVENRNPKATAEGKTSSEGEPNKAALLREAGELTETLGHNRNDQNASRRLTAVIHQIKSMGATGPGDVTTIERAEKALGHPVN
jgi:ribosomal protein S15P/S13E